MTEELFVSLEREETADRFVKSADALLRENPCPSSPMFDSEDDMRANLGARFFGGWFLRVRSDVLRLAYLLRTRYDAAKSRGDCEACDFIEGAIREMFLPDTERTAVLSIEESVEGRRSGDAEVARKRDVFYRAYMALKAKSGLKTYQDVAEAAGISRSTVVQIENYRTRPQYKTILKLAEAFGVDPVELQLDADSRSAASDRAR